MKVRETQNGRRRVEDKKPVRLPKLSRTEPRQVGAARSAPSRADRQVDRKTLLDRANEVFADRRLRPQFFGNSMFGEAGWDLLLALYIHGQHPGGTSVTSLIRFSGAPQTTVLRWLDYLEARKWVDRDRMQTNRKQANVHITTEAREALDAYLAETLRKD